MKNANTITLHQIYNDLKAGIVFGKDCDYDFCENKPLMYPYFHSVLWIANSYIFWNHFGSSANKIRISELRWIIEVIFKMSPIEFQEKYINQNQSKYYGI